MTGILVRPGEPAPDGTLLSVGADRVARRETGARELCVVVVAGRASVRSEHGDWDLGGRPDPFSGPPAAAYLPPGSDVELAGSAEVALCWAPANGGAPARVLEARAVEVRGEGN